MRTTPDCLSCFVRQASYTADLITGVDQRLRKEIAERAAELIAGFDQQLSPPENAVFLYRMIAEKSGRPDIFADLKSTSNETALKMLPRLEKTLAKATDPLLTAILLAIAGNVIDYGSHQNFDIELTVEECLNRDLALNDLADFRYDLQEARKVLYLGDNCGELAFDRLMVQTIRQTEGEVIFAVKEGPIINDALKVDAEACGLDDLCRIISNGTDCPGTPLRKCSKEFRRAFAEADLIISKGQGNFETLSEVSAPIYFLLMVKCQVVADHVAEIAGRPVGSIKTGDLVLMKKR